MLGEEIPSDHVIVNVQIGFEYNDNTPYINVCNSSEILKAREIIFKSG